MNPLQILSNVNTEGANEANDGFIKSGSSNDYFLLGGGSHTLVSNFATYTNIAAAYYTKTQLQTSGQSQVHWGNITEKPATYAPSAHNHNSLYNTDTVAPTDLNTLLESYTFKFYPAVHNGTTNLFPAVHNANGLLSISTWGATNYGHQIGFSGNGSIYHRSNSNGWGLWRQMYNEADFPNKTFLDTINQNLGTTHSPTFEQIISNSGAFRTDAAGIVFGSTFGAVKPIYTGGVLASNDYIDASKIPAYGIYSKGQIHTSEGLKYTRAINIPSGTDLDTITDAGFYDGSDLVNAPSTGWFHISVQRYSANDGWVLQTATSFGSGNTPNLTYTRTNVGGTWTLWKTLASEESVNNVYDIAVKNYFEYSYDLASYIPTGNARANIAFTPYNYQQLIAVSGATNHHPDMYTGMMIAGNDSINIENYGIYVDYAGQLFAGAGLYGSLNWKKVWTEGNFNPANYIKLNSALGINNGSGTGAVDLLTNTYWFDYNWANTNKMGSVINFSGFTDRYSTEIFASYNTYYAAIRTRNGDANAWNEPMVLWHDKNFNPVNYYTKNESLDLFVNLIYDQDIGGLKNFTGPYTKWTLNNDVANSIAFMQSLPSRVALGSLNNKDVAIYRDSQEKIIIGHSSVELVNQLIIPEGTSSTHAVNLGQLNSKTPDLSKKRNYFLRSSYYAQSIQRIYLPSNTVSDVIIRVNSSYSDAPAIGMIEMQLVYGTNNGPAWGAHFKCTDVFGWVKDHFYIEPALYHDTVKDRNYVNVHKYTPALNPYLIDVEINSISPLNDDSVFFEADTTTPVISSINTTDYVDLTSNQNVSGVKTFTSSPIIPNGTLNEHAVNLSQLSGLFRLSNHPNNTPNGAVLEGGATGTYAYLQSYSKPLILNPLGNDVIANGGSIWSTGNLSPVTIDTTQTIIGSKTFASTSAVDFLGTENNHVRVFRQSLGNVGIVSGHEYTHYNTSWKVGNKRGGNDNSVGFAFHFSTDGGATYAEKVVIGIDGNIITENYGNSDGWNQAYNWGNHAGLYSLLGHTHTKDQVGLGNVDNTADAVKNVAYATNSSKLYSTDGSYGYGSGAPYFGFLSYNQPTSRWRFEMSPATPKEIEVAYADLAGNSNMLGGVAASGYALNTALGNYMPTTHPANSITTGNITNWNSYLSYVDDRNISPDELGVGKLRFGFTSWNNDHTPPYADFLHFGGYADASGGNQNLLLINKGSFGIRQYQATSQSTTPYASFVDYWHSGNFDPTNHTHTIAQVTGLQSELDNRVTIHTPQTIIAEKTFTEIVRGNQGFQNTSYIGGRNRIWSFANSDHYGLSYQQGGFVVNGESYGEGINFHFGDSADFKVHINNVGRIYSKIDYSSEQWRQAFDWGNHASVGYLTSASLNGYVTLDTEQVITARKVIRKNLGTNDYASAAQHFAQFEIGKSSDAKSLEFAVTDDGVSYIQSKEMGVGYHPLVLNPSNAGGVGIGMKPINNYALSVNSFIYSVDGFIKSGGTANQFLKADGSVDNNTYLTGFNEQDPTVPAHVKSITQGNIAEWQGKVNRHGDTMTGGLNINPGTFQHTHEFKTDNGGGRNDIYLRSDIGTTQMRMSVQDDGIYTLAVGPSISMSNGTGYDYLQLPAWNSKFRVGFYGDQLPGYMSAISGAGYFGGDVYSGGYSRSNNGFVHDQYDSPHVVLTSDGEGVHAGIDIINDAGELRINPYEHRTNNGAFIGSAHKHKLVYVISEGQPADLYELERGQRLVIFNQNDANTIDVILNGTQAGKLDPLTKISLYIDDNTKAVFYDQTQLFMDSF